MKNVTLFRTVSIARMERVNELDSGRPVITELICMCRLSKILSISQEATGIYGVERHLHNGVERYCGLRMTAIEGVKKECRVPGRKVGRKEGRTEGRKEGRKEGRTE